jgi:hypothetical protein
VQLSQSTFTDFGLFAGGASEIVGQAAQSTIGDPTGIGGL